MEGALPILGPPYTLLVADVSTVVQSTSSTTSSYNTDLPLYFFYWSSFSDPTSHQHQCYTMCSSVISQCLFQDAACGFMHSQIGLLQFLKKSTLTLSAIWSFDVLLYVSPPLCISQHMEEIYILYLDFIATIYPFILLLLAYALIKMHSKNFKPIVVLWRLSSRLFVRFYRAWDPRSAMIQAFASLFFLSYAKLIYLIWGAFASSKDRTADGHETRYILYLDPNVSYHSTKHTLLMIFAATVGILFLLPPLLILLAYPTSLYKNISDRISPVWRIRIQTYAEIFYSSVKDGTTDTKDYRFLSTLFLFGFGLLPQSVHSIAYILEKNYTGSLYISATLYGAVAYLCTVLQPYKVANGSITGLLIILSLMFGLSASLYENPHKNHFNNRVLYILLAVPHIVFWSYIVWRVIKKRPVCSCTKPQRCDAERETLLHAPGNCECYRMRAEKGYLLLKNLL